MPIADSSRQPDGPPCSKLAASFESRTYYDSLALCRASAILIAGHLCPILARTHAPLLVPANRLLSPPPLLPGPFSKLALKLPPQRARALAIFFQRPRLSDTLTDVT